MKHDQASWGNWFTEGWTQEEIKVSNHDREVLRKLAGQVLELSQRPIEEEKIKLWQAHNDLVPVRPLILADAENGWNEILAQETQECEGSMAQDWEIWLKKEIIWGTRIKDDKPIEPVFYMPYKATDSNIGISEERIGDPEKGEAYTWKSPLADLSGSEFTDLDLSTIIKKPEINVDMASSMAAVNIAKEVFDGLLDVKIRHWWFWSPHLTVHYSNLRGLTGMMMDFYDYPEKVHEMMKLFTESHLHRLKYLEKEGLLYDNSGNTFVGSSGLGITSQLPQADFNGTVRLKDMWGLSEAQEASEVSPDMYAEFIFPYLKEISGNFGLNCYACCEPVNPIWDYVKQIPNLRRVSVSQWSNMELMSEILGDKYVYSYKSQPADLAVRNIDEELIRNNLKNVLKTTKANKNNLEIVQKDCHTIANKPENLYRFVEIAREEIDRLY